MKVNVDLDYFLREWYWEGKDKILQRYSLGDINNKSKLNNLLKKRNFLGVSKLFSEISDFKNRVVIGGPCITDSKENITIESLNDIINIILVAKELKSLAIIYLSIKEEEIRNGGSWEKTKKQFEELILEISNLLDYKNILIFDTSVVENNILIKYFVGKIKFDVTDEELDKLYYIGNNDHRLKESSGTIDETKINLHKRFLVTYLPDFISEVTGLEDPSVFVVENIQQVKAIITARKISKNKKLFHLAYLPTPSVDGKARMYSSSNEQKLFLREKDYVLKILKEANEKVRQYYFSIIPYIGETGEVNMPKSNVKDYFSTINEVFKNG